MPTLIRMNPHGRRTFLKQAATLAGAFSVNSLFHQAHAAEFAAASGKISALNPSEVAQNEDYWSVIQRSYSLCCGASALEIEIVDPANSSSIHRATACSFATWRKE